MDTGENIYVILSICPLHMYVVSYLCICILIPKSA